jgi:hypothetical protein
MSPRLVVLVCLVAGVLGVVAAVARHGDGPPTTRPAPAAAETGRVPAAGEVTRRARVVRAGGVLHRWDRQRAAAYAAGDRGALRRLYVPGSTAGAADLRVLGSYVARGLVVSRMRTQLIGLAVLRADDHRLVLRVQDRLAGAEAVSASGRAELPEDRPSTRIVTLVRSGERWLVRSVRER